MRAHDSYREPSRFYPDSLTGRNRRGRPGDLPADPAGDPFVDPFCSLPAFRITAVFMSILL